MECVPATSDELEKTAVPDASGAVPITIPNSRNCTVPVAVDGVTTAVNATVWPTAEGFGPDVTRIDETAWTTCGNDVPALIKFASPL